MTMWAWLMDEGSGTTAAEYGGTTALDFLLTNVSLGATGIDFSSVTNDYGAISNANNTPLRLSAPFSIAMRITTGGSVSNQTLFHVTEHASIYSGYNLLTNSSGVLEFMYGQATGQSTGDRRSFTGPTLATATQYDILIVCTDTSGTGTGVTIYVNGSPVTVSTSGSGGAMVYTDDGTSIGRWFTRGRNSSHTQRYLAIFDEALDSTDASSLASDYAAFIAAYGGAGGGAANYYYQQNQ
jgi:hypothetical protein